MSIDKDDSILKNHIYNQDSEELRYCFNQENFDCIVLDLIETDSNIKPQKCRDVQGCIQSLYSHIYNESLNKHVPKRELSPANNRRYKDPWITKEFKRLINKKAR